MERWRVCVCWEDGRVDGEVEGVVCVVVEELKGVGSGVGVEEWRGGGYMGRGGKDEGYVWEGE